MNKPPILGINLLTSEKVKVGGLVGSIIAANEDVMTTLLTDGALRLIAVKRPTVPLTAGSSKSFWMSVALKWNGLAVCTTASNGGLETTASSNATCSRQHPSPPLALNIHASFILVLVRTTRLRNILHNHKIQLLLGQPRVRFSNLLCFGLGANGRHDRVAAFEERVEDVCGDEAASAWMMDR